MVIFSVCYLCSIQVIVAKADLLVLGQAMARVSVSLTVPKLPRPS